MFDSCVNGKCQLILKIIFVLLLVSSLKGELVLFTADGKVEICNSVQKVSFVKDETQKHFNLLTYVKKNGQWIPMFDVPNSLVQGSEFNLRPQSFEVLEDSLERKAVLFKGKHKLHGYKWDALVEAKKNSFLIHFTVVCHLTKLLILPNPQPEVVLYADVKQIPVRISQGPLGIYYGDFNKPKWWGNSFPAAYFWSDGKEAAFFAQMTKLSWMGTRRFRDDYRVMSGPRQDKYGLGLWANNITRPQLPIGDHIIADYYLYSACKSERPSRLDALDAMINIFAGFGDKECVHPANSTFPVNKKDGLTTWKYFAQKTIQNLMIEDIGGNPGAVWVDYYYDNPWDDNLTEPVSFVRISGDYALKSGCLPDAIRNRVEPGDFSTVYNYVAPWLAIVRLNPNDKQEEFLKIKVRSVPVSYDQGNGIIMHKIVPIPVSGPQMSWQGLMFHLETLRIHKMLPDEQFNPAITGNFLRGVDGLIELANKVSYIFPQWFDSTTKKPIGQRDVPELSIIYEPWQIGTYAYLTLSAYEMTKEKKYLNEAVKSLDFLFGGEIHFSVKNQRYHTRYDDIVDFPITEIFGNSWGIAACQKAYKLTGQAKYLKYSKHFLNSLLRMTFWYESELLADVDCMDKSLKNLGLFRSHGGYYGSSPWETVEAYLPMTLLLKDDNPYAPKQLLMRLFNTMRINSFWFCPAVFTEDIVTCQAMLDSPADYLLIEDFHMPEQNTIHGNMGRVVYMSQMTLWNYLMFEAFAETDDREVMVINLDLVDGFEEAIQSAQRNFYIYNPTENKKKFRLSFNNLKEGNYCIDTVDKKGTKSEKRVSNVKLVKGIEMQLEPFEYIKLQMKHENAFGMKREIAIIEETQNKISYAYKLFQNKFGSTSTESDMNIFKEMFLKSMNSYNKRQLKLATVKAEEVIQKIK